MPKASATAEGTKRVRVDLAPRDDALLAEASRLFGLSRSETVRRLLRASIDVGPALSAENTRAVAALASQIRMVGRNLDQMLHAIHAGRAVPAAAALPVLEIVGERVRAVDRELTAITVAYGIKLRQAAHLPDLPETDG